MRGYIPALLLVWAALGHRGIVSGRALLQSNGVGLECDERSCLDLPHTASTLSKRVEITIPHDDPFGTPHENPGSGPHGPDEHPQGSPHDPSDPVGNPLSTSDDRNKILPYSDYQTRGADASSKLDQAIVNRSPDTISNYHDGYSEDVSTKSQQGISGVLTDSDVNLDPAGVYQRMKLTSTNQGNKDKVNSPVYDASYNTAQGAIVVHNMEKAEDTWPKSDPKNVKISNLMVQVYREFGGDLRNLRVVIQDTVFNPGTLATLETIYKNLGTTKDYTIGVFARPAAGATDSQAQAFYALLGTDNVRPTVYMLTDHHIEAGDKRIQKIITFPPQVGDGFAWNIAIILG